MGKRRTDSASSEKSKSTGRPAIGKQVNIRFPPDILAELDYVAKWTSSDISAIVRRIVREQLHIYIAQAKETERLTQQSRGEGEGE